MRTWIYACIGLLSWGCLSAVSVRLACKSVTVSERVIDHVCVYIPDGLFSEKCICTFRGDRHELHFRDYANPTKAKYISAILPYFLTKKVKSLVIDDASLLNAEDITLFAPLTQLSSIKINHLPSRCLSGLSALSSVQRIFLSDPTGPLGVPEIEPFFPLAHLQQIYLCNVKELTPEAFARMAELPFLKDLAVNTCAQIGPEVFNFVRIRNTHIRFSLNKPYDYWLFPIP